MLIAIAAFVLVASPATAAPGDLDPTYGDGGIALAESYPFVREAALTPDGGLAVAGDNFSVTKLTATGAVDSSFGANGTATAPIPKPQAFFRSWAVLVQADGRIVLAGEDDPVWDGASSAHFALARFLADGTPDASFGSGGMVVVTVTPGEEDSVARALAQAPNGDILACGYSRYTAGQATLALARFDAAGELDASFGSGGVVRGPSGPCTSMAQGPGATIVLNGSGLDAAGNATFAAARYLPDGRPDTSFGSGGVATTATPIDGSGGLMHVLAQPDGKVVLTAQRQWQFELLRLDAAGRPDPTFGSNGVVLTAAAQDLTCGPAALQANGKIVLGGGELVPPSDRRFAIARYLPDGSLDPSFGDSGFVYSSLGPFDYADIGGLALQPDGKIVALGDAGDSHGDLYLAALRLQGDGLGGAAAAPGSQAPPRTSASRAASARRASLRSALRSLRRVLRSRRALRHGGLAVTLALPAGNRLTIALARTHRPRTMLARGAARSRHGRARLRLKATRAGARALRTRTSIRVRVSARIVAAHRPTLAADTTFTLPTTA